MAAPLVRQNIVREGDVPGGMTAEAPVRAAVPYGSRCPTSKNGNAFGAPAQSREVARGLLHTQKGRIDQFRFPPAFV